MKKPPKFIHNRMFYFVKGGYYGEVTYVTPERV